MTECSTLFYVKVGEQSYMECSLPDPDMGLGACSFIPPNSTHLFSVTLMIIFKFLSFTEDS